MLLHLGRVLKIGGNDSGEEDRVGPGINQLILKLDGRQTLALHMQEIVIKCDLGHLRRGCGAECKSDQCHHDWPIQPQVFDSRAALRDVPFDMIEHILPSAQQQHR